MCNSALIEENEVVMRNLSRVDKMSTLQTIRSERTFDPFVLAFCQLAVIMICPQLFNGENPNKIEMM